MLSYYIQLSGDFIVISFSFFWCLTFPILVIACLDCGWGRITKPLDINFQSLLLMAEIHVSVLSTLTSHTLRREEGSGHTIELLPQQKLDVTNE